MISTKKFFNLFTINTRDAGQPVVKLTNFFPWFFQSLGSMESEERITKSWWVLIAWGNILVFTKHFLRDSVKSWIFFEGLNIVISTFCVCIDGFQGLSNVLHYRTKLSTFYLLIWNDLLILKMHIETSSEFPCLWLVDILFCQPLISCRSQAAFGMILQNHRRLSVSIFSVKVATSSYMWPQNEINFIYRRPTLYPLEIAVDFLKSL